MTECEKCGDDRWIEEYGLAYRCPDCNRRVAADLGQLEFGEEPLLNPAVTTDKSPEQVAWEYLDKRLPTTDDFECAFIGKYHGADPTDTERASGERVEAEDRGPLKPGGAGHSVLRVYGDGMRRTAYEASREACGDWHGRRRESTRLLERGFLAKRGVLPNHAPNGRPHVDAYQITEAGRAELDRLDDRIAV